MRRFLAVAVIAILALAVATPVNAGYLIVRVILEGASGSGAGGADEMGPGSGIIGGLTPGGGLGKLGGGGGRLPGPGSLGGVPGPGGGEMGPMGGGTSSGGAHKPDPTRSLVVVLPIQEDLTRGTAFYPKFAVNHFTNPVWRPKLHMNYRGERLSTNLFTDNATVQLYDALLQKPSSKQTRAFEINELHVKWTRSKGNSKFLYDALRAAVESGMIDEAMSFADELLAFVAEKPGEHTPEVTGFARAYKAMQSGVKSPASKPNSAEQWRVRLKAQGVANTAHYSLIYFDATEAEWKRRTEMLEENFKGFFLWHALHGIELPVPDAPLVAVLAKTGREAIQLARALDVPGRLPADGFYCMQHDLLVLSPERLDELGQTFTRQAQQMYKAGVGRTALTHGEGPKLNINGGADRKKPEEVARMQTLALVDRIVEDQATQATISREGSRQLLYATGQLPRYVELPEWLSNGSVSFFTRPKDPAFVTNADGKEFMAVVMTTGYGVPNYNLQRYFNDFVSKKELNPDSAALLKNILTDAYFHGLRDPKNPSDPDPSKPESKSISVAGGGKAPAAGGGPGRPPFGGPGLPTPGGGAPLGPRLGGLGGGSSLGGPPGGGSLGGPPPGPGGAYGSGSMGRQSAPEEDDPTVILRKKRDRLTIKAQATSWALYYYLAQDRPDQLRRFLDELAALPRDLPLDGDTVLAIFCRSFGIENNKAGLTTFARGWQEYIARVPTVSIDVELVEPKASTSGTSSGPGLLGMPPGGGGNPIP